ncbi:hypothetical protein BJV74DRAFT_870853 [Russula compacta]|nr:hypothetical protein BJV74DRAFT_870853 [Russula compacta]
MSDVRAPARRLALGQPARQVAEVTAPPTIEAGARTGTEWRHWQLSTSVTAGIKSPIRKRSKEPNSHSAAKCDRMQSFRCPSIHRCTPTRVSPVNWQWDTGTGADHCPRFELGAHPPALVCKSLPGLGQGCAPAEMLSRYRTGWSILQSASERLFNSCARRGSPRSLVAVGPSIAQPRRAIAMVHMFYWHG